MQVDDESSSESDEEVRAMDYHLTKFESDSLQEEFYSPGSLELLEARRRIAEYSLPRLDLYSR